MQTTRLLLLIGIAFVVAGCGGGDKKLPPPPPGPPKGEVGESPIKKDNSVAKNNSANRAVSKSRPNTTVLENDPILFDWNERLTALRKVRAGMTIGQVEKTIGMADESEEKDLGEFNPAKAGVILSTLTWRGDDPGENGDFIMIGFLNERLKDTSYIKVNAAKK